MESLQLAQVLADLKELQVAQDAQAAALVNANKPIIQSDQSTLLKPRIEDSRPPRPASTSVTRAASPSSPTSSRFEKLGRRMLTPPLTRANSAQGSFASSPRRDFDNEDDINQASTLMTLYELRAKLKQQDNSSLVKAREKISALSLKQQQSGGPAIEKKDAVRYTYPKSAT